MWPLERSTLTSGAGPEYSIWERKRSPPRSAPVIFRVAPPTEMSTDPWSRLPAGATTVLELLVPIEFQLLSGTTPASSVAPMGFDGDGKPPPVA